MKDEYPLNDPLIIRMSAATSLVHTLTTNIPEIMTLPEYAQYTERTRRMQLAYLLGQRTEKDIELLIVAAADLINSSVPLIVQLEQNVIKMLEDKKKDLDDV